VFAKLRGAGVRVYAPAEGGGRGKTGSPTGSGSYVHEQLTHMSL
jgi:hypothetical protein